MDPLDPTPVEIGAFDRGGRVRERYARVMSARDRSTNQGNGASRIVEHRPHVVIVVGGWRNHHLFNRCSTRWRPQR